MASNSGDSKDKASINTGGGAYFGGNVTAGGDIVGRDQTKTVIEQNVSMDEFKQLLGEFETLLRQSGIPDDVAQVIEGDYKVVEGQVAKDKPSGAIVKSKLNGMLEILKDSASAAGNLDKIISVGGKLIKYAGLLL